MTEELKYFSIQRYDRIVMKSQNAAWKVSDVRVIGQDSIPYPIAIRDYYPNTVTADLSRYKEKSLWPSDHFGLFAVFNSTTYNGEPKVSIPKYAHSEKCTIS
jgi:hypothetical protein